MPKPLDTREVEFCFLEKMTIIPNFKVLTKKEGPLSKDNPGTVVIRPSVIFEFSLLDADKKLLQTKSVTWTSNDRDQNMMLTVQEGFQLLISSIPSLKQVILKAKSDFAGFNQ